MTGKTKNKNLMFLFLPIILACMTTVEPYQTYPAPLDGTSAPTVVPATSTLSGQGNEQEPDSGAVFIQIVPRCATVTASEALHIRAEPSEKATVIGYLHNGEQVIIVDSRGAWWKIDTGPLQGYSKAEFLKEAECQR